MIAFFPEPYPDELVYSLFSRYQLYSGYLSHKAAMQDLFCKKSDTPSKEFVGNLNIAARDIITRVCPMDEMVLHHTMYPQYARFIPLAKKENALKHIGWDSTDPHHLFAILPRAESEQHLRYCPICVQADRKQYGEAYWHRMHQIRNMVVCPVHGCNLNISAVPAKSEQCFTFCPAELYCTDTEVRLEENHQLRHFAAYMLSVFNAPMDFCRDVPISAILYHGMSKTKYLKSTGRSRYTKAFSDDLSTFYGSMGLPCIATMNQIQRTLLMDRCDFSVVCQLAFFLGMSVDELTVPKLTPEQIEAEVSSHYMTDKPPVDWAAFDAETAKVLEPLAQSIYDGTFRADGRPERVSERLIYRVLDLQGHRLENMPLCREIIHNSRYTESYPEHWTRRLVWAYNKLKEERGDKPLHWVDLRRVSGVKERNLYKVTPLIHKYTDPKTAKIILQIIE